MFEVEHGDGNNFYFDDFKILGQAVGIADNVKKEEVQLELYPNPAKEQLNLVAFRHFEDRVQGFFFCFHFFRMLVFLYEDLRYKLIKIIDDNVDVDTVLAPEFVNLIKK